MLDRLIEVFSNVAVRQLWQVTLTVGLLLLLARWIGRRSAHWAYALLIVAALKCLCPPIWSLAIAPFCWWGDAASDSVGSESLAVTSDVDSKTPLAPLAVTSDDAVLPDELPGEIGFDLAEETETSTDETDIIATPDSLVVGDDESAVTASTTALPSIAPPTETTATVSSLPWPRILKWGMFLVWIGGIMVLLVGIVLKRQRLSRLVSRGEIVISGPIFDLVDHLRTDLGLEVPLKVVILDEPGVPGVFGMRAPTVVLPRVVLDRMSSSELRLVLAHELNHLRRQDTVCGAVQLLATVVWWFHPLVWWMNSHLRRYREHCCDEEVVARLSCRPGEYARCLLNVLSLRQELKPVVGVSALSPFDVTAQRLKNLMRQERSFSRRRSWICVAVSVLLAAVLLPGAALPRETVVEAARSLFSPTDDVEAVNDELAITHLYQSGITEPEPTPEAVVEPAEPPELNYLFQPNESLSYRITIEADEPGGVVTHDATVSWTVADVTSQEISFTRMPTAVFRRQTPRLENGYFTIPSPPSMTWHGTHGGPIGPAMPPQFEPPRFPRGPGSAPPGWPGGIDPFSQERSLQGTMGVEHPGPEFARPDFGRRETDRFSVSGGAVSLGDPCWLPYGVGDAIDWILAPMPLSLDEGRTDRTLSWPIEDPHHWYGPPMQPMVKQAQETATWQIVEKRENEWVLMRDIDRWSPAAVGKDRPESPQYQLTGTAIITWAIDLGRPRGIEFTGEFSQRTGGSVTTMPVTVHATLIE